MISRLRSISLTPLLLLADASHPDQAVIVYSSQGSDYADGAHPRNERRARDSPREPGESRQSYLDGFIRCREQALDTKTGARAYWPRTSGGPTISLGAINHIALTVAELQRLVPFSDRILHFLGYRPSERQNDYAEWEGPCGWFILRAARAGSKDRPHDRYQDSTTSLPALRAGNRLMRSVGMSCCPCTPRCSTRRGSGRNTAKATTLSVHCRGGAIAVIGAMTIRTRLRRTDRHRGDRCRRRAGRRSRGGGDRALVAELRPRVRRPAGLCADCKRKAGRPPRRAGVRRWPRAAAGATGSARPLGHCEAGSPGSRVTRAESAAIYRRGGGGTDSRPVR
jgi:hypothetical protein